MEAEMPTEQKRLVALTKHIEAYLNEVPLAWEAYLKEKSKGMEQKKAESAAMRSVYPGDNNTGVRLKTWKKHKLWPEAATAEIRESRETFSASLSEGIEEDEAELRVVKTVLKDYPHPAEALEIWKRCGVWSAEPIRQTGAYREEPSKSEESLGDTEAASSTTKSRRSQASPSTSKDTPGTSQADFGLSREEVVSQLRAVLARIDIDERKWWGKATGKAPKGEKLEPIGGKISPEVVAQVKNLGGRISHHLEKALKLYLMILGASER
jgi:hypothetical protein